MDEWGLINVGMSPAYSGFQNIRRVFAGIPWRFGM